MMRPTYAGGAMDDDLDANRAVPMAVVEVPEVHPMVADITVYSYFDTWKKTYDQYASVDWYKITMENCNDY